MKYKILLLPGLVLPMLATAQLEIKNTEDFQIGTVLKFQVCDTVGVMPGGAGDNQIWDFSKLKSKPDTVTEWMVLPSSTPDGSKFPGANQVEKYSDGSYVYVDKKPDKSYLEGYVSPYMTIMYPKPILFAERPVAFKSVFSNNFADYFTASGMNFAGTGTATVEADGHGQLILPNKTYKNVLRLKVTQIQNDTIKQYNSVSKMTIVTYAWFDGINASAVLKISSTKASGFNTKSVEYLLSEEDK